MRTIKFRGCSIDTGGWAYGYYYRIGDKHYIQDPIQSFEVNPFTIGEFTGLLDKQSKEIYEGDIVRLDSWSPSDYEVRFIDGAFCLWRDSIPYAHDIHYVHHAGNNQATIAGNIYENPELIKEQ